MSCLTSVEGQILENIEQGLVPVVKVWRKKTEEMATSGKHQNTSCTKGSEFVCDTNNSIPFRHHKQLDSSTMATIQAIDSTGTTVNEVSSDILTELCEEHSEEYINTNPCKVEYFTDNSRNILKNDVVREIVSTVDALEKTFAFISNKRAKDTLQQVLSEVQVFKKEMLKRLDQLENEIVRTIQVMKEENCCKEKNITTLFEDIANNTSLKKDSMQQLNKSNSVELQETQKMPEEYEDLNKSQTFPYEYQFTTNSAMHNATKGDNALGQISPYPDVQSPSVKTANPVQKLPHIKPSEHDEILVKTEEDKSLCLITGMIEISLGILVLTDNRNKSIKRVNVNHKIVTSTLSFGTENEDAPMDITLVSHNEVAVTVPYRQCIQFVKNCNVLEKSRRIDTNGKCYGICHHEDKLIVTYLDPGKLEILDMEGEVIASITKNTTGEDIFSHPYYVQATNEYILVSDEGNNNILMLDWKYQIVHIARCDDFIECEDFWFPNGFSMLNEGKKLIVCCWHDNKVYEISGFCMKSKEVKIDNLKRPYSVCVNEQQSKMYVSRDIYNDPSNDYLLVCNI